MAAASSSSSSSISARAQTGYSNTTAYDRHRPSYPAAVVDLLLEKVQVSGTAGARILDLGAGTGKLTESLAARAERYVVVAVEPHADMRAVLAEKKLARVEVVDDEAARADCLPLEDGSVDAVLCAQAFHWFANMDSLREIHRVLRPHGALGMVWNLDDFHCGSGGEAAATETTTTTTAWEGRLRELMASFETARPDSSRAPWREVFDRQVKSTPLALLTAGDDQLFSLPLGEHVEPFELRLSRDELWRRFSTFSSIAALEGEERERTRQSFDEILAGPDVETDDTGHVITHGTTLAAWATKIPSEGRPGLTDVETPEAR